MYGSASVRTAGMPVKDPYPGALGLAVAAMAKVETPNIHCQTAREV